MKKKALSLLLTLTMLLSLVPAFGTVASATDFTTGWTKITGTTTISSNGKYYLDSDVTGNIKVNMDKNVTLDLNGHVLKGDGTSYVIHNNGTLTIQDSAPDEPHYFTYHTNGDAWTYIPSPTQDQMNAAYTVENIYTATTDVVVKVLGGCITGGLANAGGGIYTSGTSLTISGGIVIGNTATNGGGVYIPKQKECTISGGTIIGNKATVTSGGGGGGVYIQGTFTMSGGTVSNNTAVRNGGGVFNDSGTFTMEGGIVSNNTAAGNGGGVDNVAGTFNLTGGTISGNTAKKGGGVFNNKGYFTMSGGTISNNTATVNGGGVNNNNDNKESGVDFYFNLKGGTISDNTAAGNGGGVSNDADGGAAPFTMTGGTVTGNTAAGNGGGVHAPVTGDLTLGGTAKITANKKGTGASATTNNLYLPSSKTGTISSTTPLTSGASIGVTTANAPAAGTPVAITTNGSASDVQYFFSDGDEILVKHNSANNGYLELVKKAIYYVSSSGNDSNAGTSENPYKTIGKALTAAGTDAAKIKLLSDVTENITIASGKNITLDLNGYVLKSGGANSVIINKGTLYLIDSDTSVIRYLTDSKCFHGVAIGQDCASCGTCEHGVAKGDMCDSCETCKHGITKGTWCDSCGYNSCGRTSTGAVDPIAKADGCFETLCTTYDTSGKTEGVDYLAVHGGCITGGTGKEEHDATGNTPGGGGIYNWGGTLYFKGGNIVANDVKRGHGGGIFVAAGSATMSGGCIMGNMAEQTPNGNNVSTGGYAGGVIVGLPGAGATFTMTGGTIAYNAGLIDGGVTVMLGNVFNMSGGSISNNRGKKTSGGVSNHGTMTVSGTAAITGNVSAAGSAGGIYSSNVTVWGSNDSKTTYVAVLSILGGSITGNSIKGTEAAGGIYVGQGSVANLGGTAQITGNTANNIANNIYLGTSHNTGPVTLAEITVNDDFTGTAGIAISTYVQGSLPLPITTTVNKDYSSNITSDNQNYAVEYDETNHCMVLDLKDSADISVSSAASPVIKQGSETVTDDNGIITKLTGNKRIAKRASGIEEKIAGATKLQVQLKSIDFATSGKTTVKTAKFDVKAMNGDTPVASYSTTNVSFRLPVYAADADAYKSARVYCGTTELAAASISGSGDNQYIEVSAPTFTSANSEYSYELSKVDLGAVGTTQFYASLTVRKNIDINFYISPQNAEMLNSYSVKATFNGTTSTCPLSLPYYGSEGKCVVANVYSYEMTKPVHIEVFYTVENDTFLVKSIDYSVRDYFMQQLQYDNSNNNSDLNANNTPANRKALYISALDYGTEAQKYFNGKTYGDGISYDVNYSSLANAGTSAYDSSRSPATAINILNPISVTNHLSGVLLYPSLIHGSETELMFYIDGVQCSSLDEFNQKYSVTCDGLDMSSTLKYESPNRVSVRITNITANNLGRNYRLLIQQLGSGNENNYFELKYSAVAAMKNISDSGKDVALNLALYKYGLAAAIIWGETPAWSGN